MKVQINLNRYVLVKIKEEGLIKYVKEYNESMPFTLQTSYGQFKSQADKDGYHRVQLHWLFDAFGKCGQSLTDYIDVNIVFDSIGDLEFLRENKDQCNDPCKRSVEASESEYAVETLYDWSKIPNGYNWAATDEDGHAYAYKYRPNTIGLYWDNRDGSTKNIESPKVCVNWYNSREQRPKK